MIAVKDGAHDQYGLPLQRPVAGAQYKVTGTYEMPYGLGCTLEGMNPWPYRGYILHKRSKKNPDGIWYFQEIE